MEEAKRATGVWLERETAGVERANQAGRAIRVAERTPVRHPAGKAVLEWWRVQAARAHEVSTSIGTGP